MGRTACTEPQCLYSTAIPLLPLWAVRPVQSLSVCTVELYIYVPYGPYSLYSAPASVQYSYTSTPLLAVQPVQTLSACTVELHLCSPYGSYSLYRASEPQCLYSIAIPLLPQWVVQPVQSLRASVPVQHSYTSTTPMGRTACTEPQCLFKGAIYLYLMYIASRSAFIWQYTDCTNMHGVTQNVLNTSCKQTSITTFNPASRSVIRSSYLSFHLTILSHLTDTADL